MKLIEEKLGLSFRWLNATQLPVALNNNRPLSENFIRAARRCRRRHCISDSTGKKLNYGKTLVSAIALSKQIDKFTHNQEKIGIMLPPSVAGALANLAVTMLGKVAVNLNFTLSQRMIQSAIGQCEIDCIISSRSFIQKMKNLNDIPGLVFIEDITDKITSADRLKAYLKAMFMPCRILTKSRRHSGDDLATVIFSSGSSGEPKGVMLSHHNILYDIESVRMVFKLKPDDNLCGVLPFFHSFGYTCSLWLPIVSGVSVSYVSKPLDGSLVGKSVCKNKSTVLFAAPTFFLNYIRKTMSEDFATLHAVFSGAEKLKKRIADSFEAKFGIRPLEGYGATELSPVVSLNIKNVGSQISAKAGTVGHPIPGVAVKIVDPDSFEPVPTGQSGLLMVKGPNVMLGYLNRKRETDEVLQNGWYNTGDIASLDEDGFLTITDRLLRFSKIAGEMVPHLSIEEELHKKLNLTGQLLAVTSVPNPKKGEEIVVLHLEEAGGADKLRKIISQSDLPNIWKPKKENYIKIESIPTLASGKLDIIRLRKIALKAKSVNTKPLTPAIKTGSILR